MNDRRKARDAELIDSLEAVEQTIFSGRVFRVTRADRDPLRASSPGGRWDDGTFDVLNTSRDTDGALAEMYFHLMRGQPVFPSQIQFVLSEIQVELRRTIALRSTDELVRLGVAPKLFGRAQYSLRQSEYGRTQEIAEVAHFLGADGLIVPNARRNCENLVVFVDRVTPDAFSLISQPKPIDASTWKRFAASL